MLWRVCIGFLIALSTAAVTSARPAGADEAFLCGPDKVVYVATADLPQKKLTDPCIAAHYGLTIEAPSSSSNDAIVSDSDRAVTSERTALLASELKPLSESDIPEPTGPYARQQAALTSTVPRAAANTDYRNVKILNPAPSASPWFHHSR